MARKQDGQDKQKANQPITRKSTKQDASVNEVLVRAALDVAKRGNMRLMMLYVDGLADFDQLDWLDYSGKLDIILVARSDQAYEQAKVRTKHVVRVPLVRLTRTGQIKMATMLSFSNGFLKLGDKFVFLTGLAKGTLDTMMVMDVGKEYEMFHSVDQPPLTEHIRRAVFERVLNLALELGAEGREGKPVGAIFVVGNSREVIENSQQNIINPFKGHPDSERNIIDARMAETVKEFSAIDGAFVIKGTGTIVSAGTYLLPKLVSEELPRGLGARHAAAAAITAATKCIAITISESTGTVRIWRQGRLVTEIEKAKHSDHEKQIQPSDIRN